jgi:hypothetical protein
VGTGFEPAWTALQAAASPLGHPTIKVHVWRSTRSVGYLFWRVAVFRRRQAPRADDEIRTRDPHLGKVMRYHCATSARSDLSHTGVVRPALAATRKLYPVHAVSPKPVPFTGRVPRFHADRRGLNRPPRCPPVRRRARRAAGVPTTAGHPLLSIRTQVRRAIGAVGSALRSHRRGHQFESGIAHVPVPRKRNTRRARRHRVGLFASRHPCHRGPCHREPCHREPRSHEPVPPRT